MQNKRGVNRLFHETSPYLLQHAHNPVDWFPWGQEALQKAQREQKPIFLSIGYSACHWCHVMEHESFENAEIAALMNEHFVNIKVDREERPDLDQIYMTAVQVLTQHGGWPMSVFLTPELKPFYGGTYFPPEDRMGMPGFKRVIAGVANAWISKRDEVAHSAQQLTQALQQMATTARSDQNLTKELISEAAKQALTHFDAEYGGFGPAPKFFHAMDLRLLLRAWKQTGDAQMLNAVTFTLEKLAAGGIYDQIGGGFHRYSTDREWLVPHFEKMLYDNALLAETYLEAYQATGKVEFARVARETLNYVLREMTAEAGGFYSTQDADSEGVEGKFYVWSKAEITESLVPDLAELVCSIFDVTEGGNWEGHNILNRSATLSAIAAELGQERDWLEDSLAAAFRKLYEIRLTRIAPNRDEKVLTSWNGLMIHAMALGYQVLGDERYLEAASKAAKFILAKLKSRDKNHCVLQHCYKDEQARFNGYLDDYANLLNGLVTLYESDFNSEWMDAAVEITSAMIHHFWDQTTGDFFFTGRDHEKLITRPKEIHDGATPSATAMAATSLLRISTLMGKPEWIGIAQGALQSLDNLMRQIPSAAGQSLIAVDYYLSHPQELVIAPGDNAEDLETLLRQLRSKFLPHKVMALATGSIPASLKGITNGKNAVDKKVTLYVCRNFACAAPIVGGEAILEAAKQW